MSRQPLALDNRSAATRNSEDTVV